MRGAFLATLTMAAVVMFAGCSDQETTSPAEPNFGKKPPGGCQLLQDREFLLDQIRLDIASLFADNKTKKAAGEQINNIERNLCKEPPQFDDATNKAWDFLRFTNDKIPRKFIGDAAGAANLTNMVFAFAADPTGDPPMVIPDGAFEETGGVITFDPADASPEFPIIAATTNGGAAVVIDDPDVFPPGTGMVTIILSREDGDDVVEPGGFIPGFQAFEEGYRILSTHQPSPTGPGVIKALCVVPETAPAGLVIGQLHDGNVELLVPTDPDPESLGYIDCTNATATTGGVELVAVPAWLQFARRMVQPAVKLFEPKPLNAMLFAGRGLGGRTTSLSLNAPVDPTIDVGETVQLSVGTDADWNSDIPAVATVDGNGLVTGVGPGTATITADFGDEESLSTVIAVLGDELIAFASDRDEDFEIYIMNTDGTAQVNITNNASLDGGPRWSPDGSQIAFQSRRDGNADIWLMDANGSNPTNLTNDSTKFQLHPTWSPNGTQIAFMNRTPFDQVWVMDSDGSNLTFIAGTAIADAGFPSWSPDGTKIAFATQRDGNTEIYVMDAADGSNLVNLTNHAGFDLSPVWSPDGSEIAWYSTRAGNGDVWVMDANGANPTNLTNNPANDRTGTWSPDGLLMTIDSDRDGNSEIYSMNADGTGVTRLTFDAAEDNSPAWRP